MISENLSMHAGVLQSTNRVLGISFQNITYGNGFQKLFLSKYRYNANTSPKGIFNLQNPTETASVSSSFYMASAESPVLPSQQIGVFWPVSRCISEMVQHRTKVDIDH